MRKISVFEIIFILAALMCMYYSNYALVKVSAAILLTLYIVVTKVSIYKNRKKVIEEIKSHNQTYLICKQQGVSYYFNALAFSILSMTSINNLIQYKSSELLQNGEAPLNGGIDFLQRLTLEQDIQLVIYVLFIGLGIVFIVEGLKNYAVIGDEKIIFHNGIVYDLSEITEVNERKSPFSTKKLLQIRENKNEQLIVPKSEQFEMVKQHLNHHLTI